MFAPTGAADGVNVLPPLTPAAPQKLSEPVNVTAASSEQYVVFKPTILHWAKTGSGRRYQIAKNNTIRVESEGSGHKD